MARPIKQGLDYFPMDVVSGNKYDILEGKFGTIAFAVMVKVMQFIYGENGYFCEWNEAVSFGFRRRNCPDVDINVINDIIMYAITIGIFDEGKFNEYGILTSEDIQSRYAEAKKRSKNLQIRNEYDLLHKRPTETKCNNNESYCNINDSLSNINATSSDINVTLCEQQSLKKSKVNKSKVNDDDDNNIVETTTLSQSSSSSSTDTDNLIENKKQYHRKIYDTYSQVIGGLCTPMIAEELDFYVNDRGMEEDLVCEAIKDAGRNNKCNLKYIKGILENKLKQGITTYKDYMNAEIHWENNKEIRKKIDKSDKNNFSNYSGQREVDDSYESDRQKQMFAQLMADIKEA